MYSATLPADIFVLQAQINAQEAEVKHISSSCRWHARPLRQDRCPVRLARTHPCRATAEAAPVLPGGKRRAGAGPERPPPVTVTSRDSHSPQPGGDGASRPRSGRGARAARGERRPAKPSGASGSCQPPFPTQPGASPKPAFVAEFCLRIQWPCEVICTATFYFPADGFPA